MDRTGDLLNGAAAGLDAASRILADRRRVVCVFASSSSRIEERWHGEAAALGAALAGAGLALSYGGCDLGLMGAAARSARAAGCATLGVLPRALADLGEADHACTELAVVEDLAERKRVLIQRSGGFLCLPGGIGTYDEIFEVLALRQVGEISAPLVLVNAFGYYDPLLAMLDHSRELGFVRGLVQSGEPDPDVLVAPTSEAAVALLANTMGLR